MNLEERILSAVTKSLNDGTVEKLAEEYLRKSVEKALDNLFGSWGDVTKAIEGQLKSVVIHYVEGHDYSDYIIKLDSVLADLLKTSTVENRNLLNNFKSLMNPEKIKEIKVSDLFEKWMDHVANNIETCGLDIDYDDSPSYRPVRVTFEIREDEKESWSSYNYAKLLFVCEHDENMNFEIHISRWDGHPENNWNMRYEGTPEISSLRYIKKFEIFLMNLSQNGTKLIIDEAFGDGEVQPEAEPEPMFI